MTNVSLILHPDVSIQKVSYTEKWILLFLRKGISRLMRWRGWAGSRWWGLASISAVAAFMRDSPNWCHRLVHTRDPLPAIRCHNSLLYTGLCRHKTVTTRRIDRMKIYMYLQKKPVLICIFRLLLKRGLVAQNRLVIIVGLYLCL